MEPQADIPGSLVELLNTDRTQVVTQFLELVDPNAIADRTGIESMVRGKYGPVVHASLCRFRMLGLSESNCARAAGISANTLKTWKEKYPELAEDLERAAQLVNAEVVKLLFAFMAEKGPVGLNAVKFFLARRTEEYRDRAQLDLTSSTDPGAVGEAVKQLFGVTIAERARLEAEDE